MTFADFFWLSDKEFAHRLTLLSNQELEIDDKHNVRKRKGGKLGAWFGAAQAPYTMGISLFGSAIGMRNRHVAKRRLDMIHAELTRRGLPKHAEDWKDAAFAAGAVGLGAAAGMGFVPGMDIAAQGLMEVGAMHAAQVAATAAVSETASAAGSLATEVATMHYTDPDTYFNRPKGLEVGYGPPGYGPPGYAPPSQYTPGYLPTPSPSPCPPGGQPQGGYMVIPPAPYYG